MLRNDIVQRDLWVVQHKLKPHLPDEVIDYYIENPEITEINFPVLEYPQKLKSLNFKNQLSYSGRLVGIKGQYLIFEDHSVLNVRANRDRKSTRLNSSHVAISYAVFCLKKK